MKQAKFQKIVCKMITGNPKLSATTTELLLE